MLYSIKNREDSEDLEELVQLQSKVEEVRLQDKLSKQNFHEKMNDRSMLATYVMSPLSKNTNPENSSQFKLVEISSSNRVNDLLIHNTIPITLYNNVLRFPDTGKEFELKGDFLKMITHKNCKVDLASLSNYCMILRRK